MSGIVKKGPWSCNNRSRGLYLLFICSEPYFLSHIPFHPVPDVVLKLRYLALQLIGALNEVVMDLYPLFQLFYPVVGQLRGGQYASQRTDRRTG